MGIDILGIDIMGVDILGKDIPALHLITRLIPWKSNATSISNR